MGVSFPSPFAPVLPVLRSRCTPRLPGQRRAKDVLQGRDRCFTSSGSAAIELALRLAGVSSGDEVLVPAFNCRTMVEPILRIGARPALYRVSPTLEVEIDAIARATSRTPRALVFPHYFGFPNPIRDVSKWCDDEGVVLVEDCAHAFLSTVQGVPVGGSGEFGVASLRKFYPTDGGGCLFSEKPLPAGLRPKQASWSSEARALVTVAEQSLRWVRSGRRLIELTAGARAGLRQALQISDRTVMDSAAARTTVAVSTPTPPNVVSASSRWAAWCALRGISTTAVERRRSNYLTIADAVSGCARARPLFPALGNEVAPYMVPLLLDVAEPYFSRLKSAGVPIWRWDRLSSYTLATPALTGLCPVTRDYGERLLQLPCHEGLSETELHRICDMLKRTLR
ncbi:MAG: DegT/DnrJ/EryC1/StrS aminotransferase family protein [Ectothiorhodospiraceae bacterium]|nr:DegT/DnrJ/EryC1/StrS aminotransferase family protein [Ectothiorhodospiraceae bacterium]